MRNEQTDFQSVINRLKTQLGTTTNKGVAEALGLTATNLGERKARDALPREQIDQLCETAGLNPKWIYEGKGDPMKGGALARERLAQLEGAVAAANALGLTAPQTRTLQELLQYVAHGDTDRVSQIVERLNVVTVPRYGVQASAGNGAVVSVHDEAVVDYLAFRAEWLREIGCSARQVAVIAVRGDSMTGTLEDGDLILVDTSPIERKMPGIYVIAKNDAILVKRLHFLLDGRVEIKSDNKAYAAETISAAEFENVHIVGRMVRRVVR